MGVERAQGLRSRFMRGREDCTMSVGARGSYERLMGGMRCLCWGGAREIAAESAGQALRVGRRSCRVVAARRRSHGSGGAAYVLLSEWRFVCCGRMR